MPKKLYKKWDGVCPECKSIDFTDISEGLYDEDGDYWACDNCGAIITTIRVIERYIIPE